MQATDGVQVGIARTTDKYHLLDSDQSRSLCGMLDAESTFSADIATVVSREKAENQGHSVCQQCIEHEAPEHIEESAD